jgi:hypothetical protein
MKKKIMLAVIALALIALPIAVKTAEQPAQQGVTVAYGMDYMYE